MTTELKDGTGNEFSVVTKDVSLTQNNSIRQNWHFATKYPVEHRSGGAFHTTMKSGLLTAGVLTNAPIAMFRFVSPSLICLLRSLDFSMWAVGPISAGFLSFDAFVARTFTSEDTGGTLAPLAGNVGKLRTVHQTTLSHLRVSDTVPLVVGTRTLDAAPFENLTVGLPGTSPINTTYLQNADLFKERDHPLVLENQEGVVIQATVPASGTWSFNVTAVWDEVEANNF
jgi:hypothetical protein